MVVCSFQGFMLGFEWVFFSPGSVLVGGIGLFRNRYRWVRLGFFVFPGVF